MLTLIMIAPGQGRHQEGTETSRIAVGAPLNPIGTKEITDTKIQKMPTRCTTESTEEGTGTASGGTIGVQLVTTEAMTTDTVAAETITMGARAAVIIESAEIVAAGRNDQVEPR